jgi:hypothetical protein
MSFLLGLAGRFGKFFALASLLCFVGCAQFSNPSSVRVQEKETETAALKNRLTALAPTVSGDEAARLAACGFGYSRELAQEYRVVRPALFQNLLVNVGIRKRGLCYQWAEDLLAKFQTLNLTTLELHWGMARAGTFREHNCIVVTARGQPFKQGIIFDAWRHCGNLTWAPVREDKYPWIEGELTPATNNVSKIIPRTGLSAALPR